MKALAKKQTEATAFDNAFRDWLSGEVTGHLGTYMYTDDPDDHRWKNGHSAPAYYVAQDEKETFKLAIEELNITADNFFDLGPGGEASVKSKSLRLAQRINALNYFPVDLSRSLANAALDAINLPGSPIITDFYEPLGVTKSNAFISLLGLTIGNFETYPDKDSIQERLSKIFSYYRDAAANPSYFLVSIDANTNANEIVGCYHNEEFGGLVRSCIERAIETDGFDYDVTWTPENYQLATGLRSIRDQIIFWNGDEFSLERGEFLPVLNSYRFPVNFVKEAAANAGWSHQKTWSKTGRVHYLLFA